MESSSSSETGRLISCHEGLERFLSTQLAWKDALLMLERVQQGAARLRSC